MLAKPLENLIIKIKKDYSKMDILLDGELILTVYEVHPNNFKYLNPAFKKRIELRL